MFSIIIGGSEQGKLAIACREYSKHTGKRPEVCDADKLAMVITDPEELRKLLILLLDYDVIDHLHLLLRRIVVACTDDDYDELIENWLGLLLAKHNNSGNKKLQIFVLDDIGSGVVPLDAEDRKWRERCGRLYCRLTEASVRTDRVWAGLLQTLKNTQSLSNQEDRNS